MTTISVTISDPVHKNNVLVLSTVQPGLRPMLIDFDGEKLHHFFFVLNHLGNFDNNLNFDFEDETYVHYGCGATLLGEMWYFGGLCNAHNQYCRQVNL